MLAISPNNSLNAKEEIQDSPTETQEQEEVIREPGMVAREQPKGTMVEEGQLLEEGTKHKVPSLRPRKLTCHYEPEWLPLTEKTIMPRL
jgi:hypothetical protein